jgi:hypothetical protein
MEVTNQTTLFEIAYSFRANETEWRARLEKILEKVEERGYQRAQAQSEDYGRTINEINTALWGILYPENPESWEYVTQPLVHIRTEINQLREGEHRERLSTFDPRNVGEEKVDV